MNNKNNNNDLSSEKIAKALKGAGLSVEERIVTATEAWSNNQLFFPNKDDFLFEWLCTALTKTKVKSPTECAAYQIAYWRLFRQLLAHYTERAENTRKQPPAIRVQLITAITTLLNHLKTITNENMAKNILLELYECVKLLLSPTFGLSYRPTFEQMSTTVDQLMDTLTLFIDKQYSMIVDSLLPLSSVLLRRYVTQLVQTANQRKSFTTIIDKMFVKILCVRRRTVNVAHEKVLAQTISDEVTDILVKALFHPDVVLEYTSVLKKDQQSTTQQQSITKNKTSYVSKLFEELGQLLENKNDQELVLDALDILPVLFDNFVQAFRKKRGNTASQDIDRQVEFGFFTECRNLLDKLNASAPYVQTLSKLLQILVQLNVYVARNDELSQQQSAVLDGITETMIHLLKDQNKRAYQGCIFELANTILKVDFSLIEGRVSILWPYMLNPEKEAENHCLDLAMAVLQTYAASRQMESYVDDLITGLQGLAFEDVYIILEKPLFSRQFMDE
ncbi:hypothetical protein BDC45DRAFT_573759 [Circinella umbellata]|nr:hypothetical protein BDC45DRAFT_573759 [Circinella umbellata]